MNKLDPTYKQWLTELKGKIRSVQIKAAIAVNTELILFYWELGKMIAEKQTAWGSRFMENLSKDLQDEFPDMKGFSVSNLKTCKLFFDYFSSQAVNQLLISEQVGDEISQHPVLRIPWGHIKVIITKIKNRKEANKDSITNVKFFTSKT